MDWSTVGIIAAVAAIGVVFYFGFFGGKAKDSSPNDHGDIPPTSGDSP